jgi:DHA1 family multidrug resistance protein-like MFS transporter
MQTLNSQPNNLLSRLMLAVRNSPPMRYPELGLICLAIFVELVGVGAVVPIRTIYAREQGATLEEIGFMASAFVLGNFLLQLPGGWASDRWGRKPFIVGGVAVAGILSFLMLLNDHPWYFIGIRFIEGAASGAIGPAANAYVIDAVPAKERGAAFGWLGSAFSAGFMLGPAIGGVLADLFGYYAPFIFAGVTTLLIAGYLWRKMEDHKAVAVGKTVAAQPELDVEKSSRQIPRSLFVPALVTALLLITASGFADGLFISIWSIWLNDLHASNSYIGLTFIVFSLPMMVLMPITGRLADKYSLAPIIAIPSILTSGAYLAYGFTTDLFTIAALGLVEGTLIALIGPATSAFVANLSPDNARGRLQGVVSTTRSLSAFTSSILVALLYKLDMTYPFFMLAGVQIFIAVVAGFFVWRIEARTRQTNRVEIAETELQAA